MKKLLLAFFLLLTPLIAYAQFTTTQGGTGTSSPSGILYGNGTLHLGTVLIGSGCSFTGGTLSCAGTGGSSFAFPFTVFPNYNATTTVIGFNGLFSTASSTFSGPFRLPSLSNGELSVFGGLVSSGATTTAGTGLTYSGNAFNVNTSQNISTLSNLTTNGFVITSGGTGALSVDTTSYTPQTRTITVAGTANQITSSAGAQDLSANRTWTLSFPNQVIFPQYASSTLGFSTPYASSTQYFGANLLSCNGGTNALTWSNGVFGCNTISTSGSPGGSNGQVQYNGSGSFLGVSTSTIGADASSLSNSGTPGFQIGGSNNQFSINTGHTNNWSVLQNFNYASTSLYASFLTASSTHLFAGDFTLSTTSAGCAAFNSSGNLFSIGTACGSGSGAVSSVSNADGSLTISPTTGSVVASIAPAHTNIWTAIQDFFGNASTTGFSANYASIGGTGTTTITQAGNVGVGTTTPWASLSINAASQTNPYFDIGSSTSDVFNISPSNTGSAVLTISTTTAGCSAFSPTGVLYSTGNPCGTSSGLTSYDAWTHPFAGSSATTSTMYFNTGGLDVTASTTLGSTINFPALTQGNLYIGSLGRVLTQATSTIGADTTSILNSGTPGFQIGGSNNTFSINTANTNTWSVLQNFNYSSSTIYSSFKTASSTFLNAGSFTLATSSAGCAAFMNTGLLVSTGAACGSGGGSGTVSSGTINQVGYYTGATTISSSGFLTNLNTANWFGIGTTTPQFLLNLSTTTAPQLTLSSGSTDVPWNLRSIGGNFYISTSSPKNFSTTSIAALTINSNGNVGIGTTSPSATFAIDTSFYTAGNTSNAFAIGSASSGTAFSVATSSSGLLLVGTSSPIGNNLNLMTVPGKVVIATTTTPQLTLQGATGDIPFNFRSIGGAFYIATSSASKQATSTVSDMIIDANGKVYFPSTQLQSGAATDYWCYDTNSQLIRVSSLCTTSALKFKKNITPLTQGLSTVMAMKPVNYYLNDLGLPASPTADQLEQQIGFVADYEATNTPLLIIHDGTGAIHGFNYEQYTAILTKAIQDQQKEIENLQPVEKSAIDNWQSILILMLFGYIVYNEVDKRKRK